MTDDVRWIAVPDTMLVQRLRMPEPSKILFASVVDVLALLDEPERLRDTLELLLASQAEMSA